MARFDSGHPQGPQDARRLGQGSEKLSWKRWMVEAVGVEPTSEKRVSKASTCVSLVFWFSPFAFWSRALRRGGQPLSYPEAARGCRDLRSTTSVVLEERRGSGLPTRTSRLFRPRGRSYRSQLLFRLTGGIRHATLAPLCSPSKPVRPQVLKEPCCPQYNRSGSP